MVSNLPPPNSPQTHSTLIIWKPTVHHSQTSSVAPNLKGVWRNEWTTKQKARKTASEMRADMLELVCWRLGLERFTKTALSWESRAVEEQRRQETEKPRKKKLGRGRWGGEDAVACRSDRQTLAGQRDGSETDRLPDADNSDVDGFRRGKGGRDKVHFSTLAPKLPNYSSISICQWEGNV